MALPPPSGFAIRRNGSCPTNEVDCGATAAPFHACCPSGSSCPNQYNVDCCPSPANCTETLLEQPRCANATWSLYDNHGYFCCSPGTIGYNASRTFSSGCAAPGSPPRGAELLAVVSAGQTATSSAASSASPTLPSSPSPSSASSNTGAIAGGVIGGVAAIVIAGIISFYLFRKRKNRSVSETTHVRYRGSIHEKDATGLPVVDQVHEKDAASVPVANEADGSALYELSPSNRRSDPIAELR